MIKAFAARLDSSSFADFMSDSSWAFPAVESIHVIALVTVLASIFLVDIRLVGASSPGRSVRELTAKMLPLTWIAFVVALITGSIMFASKASSYLGNSAFLIKMSLMLAAGFNMLMFHFLTYRSVASWDVDMSPPPAARIAGGLSIALWAAIACAGRWIGFLH